MRTYYTHSTYRHWRLFVCTNTVFGCERTNVRADEQTIERYHLFPHQTSTNATLFSFTLISFRVCLSYLILCWCTNSCLMCVCVHRAYGNLNLFRFSFRLCWPPIAFIIYLNIFVLLSYTNTWHSGTHTSVASFSLWISLRHLLGILR